MIFIGSLLGIPGTPYLTENHSLLDYQFPTPKYKKPSSPFAPRLDGLSISATSAHCPLSLAKLKTKSKD
jgi:hypothetical protein